MQAQDHIAHEQIDKYIDRADLSEADRLTIEKHLAQCPECRETAASLKTISAALSHWTARKHGEAYQQADPERRERTCRLIQEKLNPSGMSLEQEETQVAAAAVKTNRHIDQLKDLLRYITTPKIIAATAAACLALFIALRDPSLNIDIRVTGFIHATETQVRGPDDVKTLRETDLKDGQTILSGEYFRIHFSVDRDAYVYALIADSSGGVTRLFSGKMKDGEEAAFPDNSHPPIQLDDQPGTETVYVLAFDGPVDDFEQKIRKLTETGGDAIKKAFPDAVVQSFRLNHL